MKRKRTGQLNRKGAGREEGNKRKGRGQGWEMERRETERRTERKEVGVGKGKRTEEGREEKMTMGK